MTGRAAPKEATPTQPHLDWQARASMIRRMDEEDFDWDELGGKWERHAFRCLLDLIAAEKEIARLRAGAALPVPETPTKELCVVCKRLHYLGNSCEEATEAVPESRPEPKEDGQ